MELARAELATPDNSLPDPESLSIAPGEIDFIYRLWVVWRATDKRYLPSQLVPELLSGHGRLLTDLFDVDALYGKVMGQLKGQKPNE